jgi:molybdate transport system substrate-binding protein
MGFLFKGLIFLWIAMVMAPVEALPVATRALPTLTVWSAGGMLPALQVLAPGFEQASGMKVVVEAAPSTGKSAEAVGNRLARREPADIVLMIDYALAQLQAKGQIEPSSRVDLGKSFIAMAVRQGAAKPPIDSVEAFKAALLAADSIAYTDSASGLYLSRVLFPRLGLAAALQRKAQMLPGPALAEALANGTVQVGFAQLSELKAVPGIDVVGLIPDPLQQMTLYATAVLKDCAHRDAALAFVDYLASPEGRKAIVASGLQPVR